MPAQVISDFQPWQQEVICLAADRPGSLPAELVNLITNPPAGLTGRQVQQFITRSEVVALVQQHRRALDAGEAAA
jgi:hypothetical protein